MKTLLLSFLAMCFAGAALADVPKKAAAPTTAHGLVWKIEGGKVPVYLAGSFHLLRKEDHPLPEPLYRAYGDSEQVYFEIAPGEMEKPEAAMKMMTAGMLGGGKTLKDVVSEKTYTLVEKWDGEPTLKLALDRMQPWLGALTIMMTEYQKLGIDPQYGIEKTLQERAKMDGKTTGGFESVELQMGLFTGLSAEQQEQMLAQTFEELGDAKTMLPDMIKSWKAGDDKAMDKQMNESFDKYPGIKKVLLSDRNAAWVPKVEELMKGDKKTLVVVGAGHLCGEGSVVDLLQKKGVKLTKLEAGATAPKVD